MKRQKQLFCSALVFLLFSVACNASATEALKTEIVVIGAGAAGLSAALTAAQGEADVVILEKMPFPGGTSNFAEGLFAAESPIQRAQMCGPSIDEAFRGIMEYTHWRANPRLARAFVKKSSSTIAWLMNNGVKFTNVMAMWPTGPRTWHIPEGRSAGMIKTLMARINENENIKVLFRSPATKLQLNDDNRVTTVFAEDADGKTLEINTKAVIIATGGFANNKEMLKRYIGFSENIIPVGNVKKVGDGIRMATEVGADTEGLDVIHLLGPGMPKTRVDSHLFVSAWQPSNLWVNVFGERFCDESIIYNFPYAGNALAKQKDCILYSIFDEAGMKYMVEEGIDLGIGVITPVGTKLTKFNDELGLGEKNGNVYVADSLKELALKIGLDQESFISTVKEYNRFCDQGYDDFFLKDRRYLKPIRKPKFFAMKCSLFFMGTLGGIKINEKAEVLTKNYEAIKGLYAAGNCAGGMYGDTYDLYTSGGTLGFAVNSGRMAAESSLNYIRQLPEE